RGAFRSARRPLSPCGHDDDVIEAAALGLLGPAEQNALAERLAACATCRANFEVGISLTASLKQLIPSEEVAAGLDAAAEGAVVADFRLWRAADAQRHGSAQGAIAGGPAAARLPNRSGTLARAGRLTEVASGLAATLLLLVLVGGFWFLGPGRGRT